MVSLKTKHFYSFSFSMSFVNFGRWRTKITVRYSSNCQVYAQIRSDTLFYIKTSVPQLRRAIRKTRFSHKCSGE